MDRSFRSLLASLLIAKAISEFGDWLIFIFIVTTIYTLSESAFLLGLFFTIQSATTMVVAPFASYVLERAGVTRLLYQGRFLQSVVVLLPLAIAVSTRNHRWMILSLFAAFPLLRAVDVIAGIGVSTLLPRIFSGKALMRANAAFSTTSNLLTIAAPAASGILLSYLNFSQALIVDLVSYALSGLLILPILAQLTSAEKGLQSTNGDVGGQLVTEISGQIRQLFEVLRAVPFARYAILVVLFLMLGGGAINTIMPAFALTIGDTKTFGYITSLTGAGFLITSGVLMARPLAILPQKLTMLGLGIIAAADISWYLAQNEALAIAIAFINGVGNELYSLGFTTFLQTNTAAGQLSRLLASVSIVREGAAALSPALGGALGGVLGIRSVFLFASALSGIGLVLSSLLRVRTGASRTPDEPGENKTYLS